LTPRTSRGFEVIQFAEDVLELELYPWEKWLLIHALELNPDGTFRFRTLVLLVARQNGKSLVLAILSLWRIFVDDAPLVIGTAQNLDIAEEVWQAAVDMAEDIPELAAEIQSVDRTNGKKALRLLSGSRYKVQAATRRGGRGLTGDMVLLDELREHQNWDAWGAVTKTTRTRALAQIWAASNAGDLTSVVLAHLRMLAHLALGDPDGINGDDVRLADIDDLVDDSLGIFEWSAKPGCDIWDRNGWAQANPSMGYIPSMERSIAADAATDPDAVFRTEVLCQWVDSMQEGAFPAGVWETNRVSESVTIKGKPVLALDVRTGMKQSFAIAAVGAGKKTDVLELVHYESGIDEKWARKHIVSTTVKLLKAHGLDTLVIDKYGENAHLIQLFEDSAITVVQLDTTDMRNGCVGITDALINGQLKHHGDDPLTIAVLGAGKRQSGELFMWSQSKSTTDICALRAATAAFWVHVAEPGDYDLLSSFG
jgi:phage terminase large subunit-like protein